MALSVDELRDRVLALREEGLNDQQIADEMSISSVLDLNELMQSA